MLTHRYCAACGRRLLDWPRMVQNAAQYRPCKSALARSPVSADSCPDLDTALECSGIPPSLIRNKQECCSRANQVSHGNNAVAAHCLRGVVLDRKSLRLPSAFPTRRLMAFGQAGKVQKEILQNTCVSHFEFKKQNVVQTCPSRPAAHILESRAIIRLPSIMSPTATARLFHAVELRM